MYRLRLHSTGDGYGTIAVLRLLTVASTVSIVPFRLRFRFGIASVTVRVGLRYRYVYGTVTVTVTLHYNIVTFAVPVPLR